MVSRATAWSTSVSFRAWASDLAVVAQERTEAAEGDGAISKSFTSPAPGGGTGPLFAAQLVN
jgi:hypothetical protein